ncbi:helix-turn-helix transcriptional regulator [Metapseudomonas otitidis]|uniref:helix-turn-helix transcriptional regulator n=1 Tax=Metapseudomonas otitidis TaxID=319939 RepID=UPI001AAF1FD6|nr:helix-turn-helix transcriptional regulator [Pseudomonas otitidis]MBO2927237.1 helix-turn-helix domain containing protein [Pseudomonas otitidis]
MDRLHEIFGVKNDNQLGDALQVNRSTLGNWRSRDSVPYTICVDVALERGVSLDWLLTGEGAMYRENIGNAPAESADSPREQAMLALWRELDEEAQRDIQRHAEDKKRLKNLEMQLQELSAAVAALNRSA